MRYTLLLSFFVFFLFSLSAEDPYFMDQNVHIRCSNIDGFDSYYSYIDLEHQTDGTIKIHTQSDYYEFFSLQDRQMRVIEYQASYDHPFYSDQAGLKYYHLQRLEGEQFRMTRINKRGKESVKELELQSSGDFNQIKFLLPWTLAKNGFQDEFEFYLFEPSRNLQFHLALSNRRMKKSQIHSYYNEFSFPEEWSDLRSSSGELIIVEATLTGIAGAIYSHPFIYALDKNYKMQLEWGGNPRNPYFTRYEYLEE